MIHGFRINLDPILGWLAHCTCGKWDDPMGWASQRQAKRAWQQHVRTTHG